MDKIKRPLALVLTVLLICGIWFGSFSAQAASGIVYKGSVSYGGSTCGVYEFNGSLAFCMEHKKASVPSGTNFKMQVYGNNNIRKTLYYGYGGTKQWSGFKSKAHGIVATSLVLSHYYSGTKIGSASQSFYNWLVNQPSVPDHGVKLSASSVSATIDKNKKIQKTPTIKFTADKTNYITMPLPSGVKLYNVTTKKTQTGKVKIYGGQSFYLYASWTARLGTWKSGTMTGDMKEFQAVLLKTSSAVQNQGARRWAKDPAAKVSLTVKWKNPMYIKVNKTDADTGKGSPQSGGSFVNTSFKVCTDAKCKTKAIASGTIKSGSSVTIGPLAQGTYYIQETKVGNGYTLNTKIYKASSTAAAGSTPKTPSIKIPNKRKVGNIAIWKVGEAADEEGAKDLPLKGAKFSLIYGGKTVKTGTTDTKGYLLFSKLPTGRTYTIKETYAPKPFKCVAPFNVKVNDVKTYTYKPLKDYRSKTPLMLEKHDAETKEVLPLAGITYELYKNEGGKLEPAEIEDPDKPGHFTNTFKTDEQGIVELPVKLAVGKYCFKEIETPPGSNYLVNDYTLPFTVDANASEKNPIYVEDYDYVQKGKLRLIKTDEETKEPLPGVNFEVVAAEDIQTLDGTTRAKEGEVVARLTTNGEGKAETGELYLGKYKVVETRQKPGYERPKGEWPVELTPKDRETEVTTHTLNTTNLHNRLEILKLEGEPTGEEDDNGNPIIQGVTPLVGVKMRIWKASDEELSPDMYPYEEYTTGLDGKIHLKGLGAGTYRIQEVETLPGYVLDDTVQTFTVDADGYIDKSTIIFYNLPAKGKIEIKKTDSVTGEPVQGAEFDVIAAENIQTPVGTGKIKEGETVAHITTDEEGRAETGELYLGRYQVVETKQATGYERPKDVWEVELKSADQTTALVKETLEITNTPARVDVKKVETGSGKPLAGIRFVIWKEEESGGTVKTPTDAVEAYSMDVSTPTDALVDIPGMDKIDWYATPVTDEEGRFHLSYLTPGTYHVREAETLPGYVLDDTEQIFTVDEAGYIDRPELEFINDYTKLTVNKVDEKEEPLKGAKLQLQDESGKVIEEWVSDGELKRYERLPAGKYKLIETEAPAGYELAEPMEFELIDTAEEQSIIMIDEKIPPITVTEVPPEEKKPGEKKKLTELLTGPGTGDMICIGIWILLGIGAAIGLFIAIWKIRKK